MRAFHLCCSELLLDRFDTGAQSLVQVLAAEVNLYRFAIELSVSHSGTPYQKE